MTTVIKKDKNWLKEEIENGVYGYLDLQAESLSNIIMKYVYEQIYLSACAVNIESETDDPGKLIIEIDIPTPDECVDAIDNLGSRSLFKDI